MDRASKLLVLGWTCLALAAELWLLRGWGLNWLAIGGFLTAFILVALDRRAIAVVLVFAYVFPALIRLTRGFYIPQFSAFWMAALVGAILADPIRSSASWHVPVRWRGALICWALVVMVGVPIVIGREIDFNPVLLFEPRMETSILGVMPGAVVSFVLHVGLVPVLGILWFDWLFAHRDLDFGRIIATPLLVSVLAMAGVAIYQLFVDVTFLNESVYGNVGRASGTVYDANVCGTIAALWIGGAVLWTLRRPGPAAFASGFGGPPKLAAASGGWVDRAWSAQSLTRKRLAILTTIVAALWLAVWATGSRTSFAAALIVSGFSLAALHRAQRGTAGWRLTPLRFVAASGGIAVLLVLVASLDLGVIGPLQRLRDMLPGLTPASPASWREFVLELWNRNYYGVAANAIIREFPFVGVGVGSFHHLAPDFVTNFALPPDNAQNWYRHQLTEFGVIGSLGWIVWVAAFAAFVLRRPSQSPPIAWASRGMLIAFALISLVGMPAQEIVAAITFWTAAYWYASLAGVPGDRGIRLQADLSTLKPDPTTTLSKWAWVAIAAVVGVYTAGTVSLAAHRLRVPVRALETGKPYSYGFYYAESDRAGVEWRWARRRSAIVLDAPTDWVVLRLSVNHRDVAANPVDVRVWRDGVRVVSERLTTTDTVTKYVHIPGGRKRVLLETWVSRTVTPKEHGVDDVRELGLLVNWSFVASPDAVQTLQWLEAPQLWAARPGG